MKAFVDKTLVRLEKIAPRWTKHLRNDKTKHKDHGRGKLNILNGQYCIVGEAHGFSSNFYHTCNKCANYSGSLIKTTSILASDRRNGFRNLDRFINHFMKTHRRKQLKGGM